MAITPNAAAPQPEAAAAELGLQPAESPKVNKHSSTAPVGTTSPMALKHKNVSPVATKPTAKAIRETAVGGADSERGSLQQ